MSVHPLQISNRVLYVFFTHVQEFFGNVTLKQVTKPLRWSNMATMPALPETQESIKEEIRRQVGNCLSVFLFIFALAFIHLVENSPKFVTYTLILSQLSYRWRPLEELEDFIFHVWKVVMVL